MIFMTGPSGITNFVVLDRLISQVLHKPNSTDAKIERQTFWWPQESQMKFRPNSSTVHSYLRETWKYHQPCVKLNAGKDFTWFCCCQIKSYYSLTCWVLNIPQLITGKYLADHYSGARGIEYKITSVEQGSCEISASSNPNYTCEL